MRLGLATFDKPKWRRPFAGDALKSIEQLDRLYQPSTSPMDETLQGAGASPQEVEKSNAIKVQEGTPSR